MQAMTSLYSAWADAGQPALASAPRHVSPPGFPPHLHMRALDVDAQLVRISFYLGRVRALSPCELEVARWANEGHTNAAIAALRGTSVHTVARLMSNVIFKLGLGSRLDLATVAELTAWAPPGPRTAANENGADASWLKEDGLRVEPQEALRIWREVASGQWTALASVDVGTVGYVALRRVSRKTVDWAALRAGERAVLGQVAQGVAQKVIAMKLGMAASTVSANLHSARRRLGLASFAQLVKAYCAARDVIEPLGPDAQVCGS